MATIKEMIAAGVTREEIIQMHMERFGMTREYAEFVVAMDLEEVTGDVIVLNEGEDVNQD